MEVYLVSSYLGAKMIGVSLRNYFSSPRNIYIGQKLFQQSIGHDCLYAGIPNLDTELLKQIEHGCIPKDYEDLESGKKVLEVLELLSGEDTTVLGSVTSPIKLASKINSKNKEIMNKLKKFCKKWIEKQIRNGAEIIVFNDCFSNRDEFVSHMDIYRYIADKKVWYFGGRVIEKIDLIENAGFGIATVSSEERITSVRGKTNSDIVLAGNLNAREMTGWDQNTTRKKVIECISDGMRARNFILSGDDEISYYTGLATLRTIVSTAREFSSN